MPDAPDPRAAAPASTYRLQLGPGFGFEAAAAIVPGLARLGITHLYLSPCFAARPGSEHGYDVVDHNRLNPELGGDEGWALLQASLRRHGLQLLLDIVPNHVGIGGAANAWWLDVLEWGAASPHAVAFDIRWFSERAGLAGQVLVPLLGCQYGEALEDGQFDLRFDAAEGSLSCWLPGDHRLPIRPADYAEVLRSVVPGLDAEFRALRTAGAAGARTAAAELRRALAAAAREPAVAAAIGRALRRWNGTRGRPASFDRLDRLIARQYWRAASHRVATDDINYRRFFNVNELAGLRVEVPEVFDAVHRLCLRLVAAGEVQGLRIDHVDGLHDPAAYCRRLRERVGADCYIVVEKILGAQESLPAWPVQGTTGYDFIAQVSQLFVDPSAEAAITALQAEFTGERPDFDEEVADCKRLIMRRELASELAVLAHEAVRIAMALRRSRDFTLAMLTEALREVVAWFPVYRSYVAADGRSPSDEHHIDRAVARARARLGDLDPTVFDFLGQLLRGELAGAPPDVARDVLRFAMKLQQYTGPVMAKGMEDTAFYRYTRCIALNEVGGLPATFGLSVASFHQQMQRRATDWPASLLAGSTHDTKRGEDLRARLIALTGFPQDWEALLRAGSRLVRARLGDVEGLAPPARSDESLLLQTLLGAWPEDWCDPARPPDEAALAALRDRVAAAMQKSAREARRHSSWLRPDAAYEEGVRNYLAAALDLSRPNAFLDLLRATVARVAPYGRKVALAQLLLRLTVPGVPDIYQGSEAGDFSLVDPDNRRPVDFARLAASLDDALARPFDATSPDAKLALLARLLPLRRRAAGFVTAADYRPIDVQGPAAGQVIAFERRAGTDRLVVIATRLQHGIAAPGGLDATTLGGTGGPDEADLPTLTDLLDGRRVDLSTDLGTLLGARGFAVAGSAGLAAGSAPPAQQPP